MNCCSTNGSCSGTDERLVLFSNIVREIVPAFDTREIESSHFIFLPGFGNLQISSNSASIL